MPKVFNAKYDHYFDLPESNLLVNPLTDYKMYKEENEMYELYKLCNQFYSPEYGYRILLDIDLYPFQMSMHRAINTHKFPMLLLSRGGSKTFTLAANAVYHAVMNPGTRIILISATFRQSRLIFKEIKRIYSKAPLLRAMSDKAPVEANDSCYFHVNDSSITALPLGGGERVRGERGHVVYVDEFDAINKEIFDVVIRGFGATQSDPWHKTREYLLYLKKLKKTRESTKDQISAMATVMSSAAEGNKIVISGTAGHHTGPYYKLYSQYLKIIKNQIQGNLRDYQEIIGADDIESDVNVDYKQYAIIKYTYLDLPVKLMEVDMIHSARTTMSKMYFDMEYRCIFADDSAGFFKWKDIQAATARPPGWHPYVQGKPGRSYVFGIDPARSRDRFALAIIELGTPNKVVYIWSCKNKSWPFMFKRVRKLMRLFNPCGIALDTGGGGSNIQDMFVQREYMEPGDRPIIPFDADEKKMEIPVGASNILYPISFQPIWIDEANMMLQKTIEEKTIEFPPENVSAEFKKSNYFEIVDDATNEINKMKKELTSIEVSYNQSGTRRFNLKPPDIKSEPGEIITHKDRYSALLLANYLAFRLQKLSFDPDAAARKEYEDLEVPGGFLEDFQESLGGDEYSDLFY